MTKFPKALLAIFALGAMSLGCGLGILGRDGGDVGVGFVDVDPYDDGPIGIKVSGGASGGVLIENCRVTNNIIDIRDQEVSS